MLYQHLLATSQLFSVTTAFFAGGFLFCEAIEAQSHFNLAKFQTTTSSSNLGDWPPQFATDGLVSADSRWRSSSSTTSPHWLEIELAVPMTIGSAHIYSGGNSDSAIVDFDLQYHDGTFWVTIPGSSVTGNTISDLNITFTNPVTAQRFRLYSTDTQVHIRDLALYAPTEDNSTVPFGTDVDLNVAKLRQYEFSSLSTGNPPKLAIDGYIDSSSAWLSENAAGPHDLEIHFPRAENIAGIHLYSGFENSPGSQVEDFEISYYFEGSWVTYSGGSITGNTDFARSLSFTSPVLTNKIRLRTLDAKQAIVRELVVLHDNGANLHPLGTDVLTEEPPSDDFLKFGDHFYTLENVQALNDGVAETRLTTSSGIAELTELPPYFQVLLNIGTDTYRIRNIETGACFEVEGASTSSGAAIIEGNYSSMPHQRWQLIPRSGTIQYKFVNVWSGMALTWNGTSIVQAPLTNNNSQYWRVEYETHFPKQGQASHFHFANLFKSSWAYRWTFGDENTLPQGQYMPMQWGGIAAASPGILDYQHLWYRRANQTTVMGFNEPDLHDQANIESEVAAYQWPRLERMRLPLLGPCPANRQGTWRQEYEALASERDLRCDYMGIHWYSTSGASSGSPTNLINQLKSVYDNFGNKPIWLTEFSTRDFVGDKTTWSRNHNYNFLAEFAWRAESLPWLAKWSLFEWSLVGGDPATTDASATSAAAARSADPAEMNSPRLALHYSNDSTDPGYEDLSECGLFLAGWDGDANVRTDKPYIIHNKGRFLRLIDHPDNSAVTLANVTHRNADEQFIFQETSNGNYYITGLSDGRRLHYDGSSVGLSPKETTGTIVEWRLNEWQHGWFYIDHPATNSRLRITNSNVIDVASNDQEYDNLRFRFISPAVPISLTEKQTLPYFEGFENGIGAWRQFYDDDYDWEIGTGDTPTTSAGPSRASFGDYYLFAEGHDTFKEDAVTNIEACFDLSTATYPELRFHYHMNGFYIDYLTVDIHDGTSWTTDVWRRNKQQMTETTAPWLNAIVDLTDYAGNPEVKIRFRTATTEFNSADPAIDNITIQEATDPIPLLPGEVIPTPIPFEESFETGLTREWLQSIDDDIDWTLSSSYTPTDGTGPTGASDGEFYLYFEGHDSNVHDKSASIERIFDFSESANTELTFDYHMFGPYVSLLSIDVHDGNVWNTNIWSLSGQQQNLSTAPWLKATVDLSTFDGLPQVTIRFRAQQAYWHAADTAIDNIRIWSSASSLSYEVWSETAFVNSPVGTDTSETGNPDNDSLDNYGEFVLGTDPLLADSPIQSIIPSTTHNNTIELTFTRRKLDGIESYAVWSEDLFDPWTSTGLIEIINPGDPIVSEGEIETVTVQVPIDHSKKFVRIEVEYAQ